VCVYEIFNIILNIPFFTCQVFQENLDAMRIMRDTRDKTNKSVRRQDVTF